MGAGAGKINVGAKLLFLLGAELFMCRSLRNFFPEQNCRLWPEQSCKELLIHNLPTYYYETSAVVVGGGVSLCLFLASLHCPEVWSCLGPLPSPPWSPTEYNTAAQPREAIS